MGEKNLEENKRAYEELKKKARFTRPRADQLLAEATRIMEDSRKFVEAKKIASMPFDDRAVVKETPPYMRWNSAFLDASGPFDAAKLAFYYITMPEKTWSRKEQEEYIMTHGILLSTTVHEVYPGHFLQSQ